MQQSTENQTTQPIQQATGDQPSGEQSNAAAINPARQFNLKFGYQDKEDANVVHREVIISRRPTGADFFKAVGNGTDDKAANMRVNLSLVASAVSKFGGITMPMPLTVLYTLNEIDENRLNEEYLRFLINTQPDVEQQVTKDNRAQLAFGIERDGVKYHVIEFGKLLNGYDRIKILEETSGEQEFQAAKMAREVVSISTLDGAQVVPGELTLADIEAMDFTDVLVLREAEGEWLDSFRDQREETAENLSAGS